MISDVLFEAHREIRRYLDHPHFAGVYEGPIRPDVERVLSEMAALRARLDTPPGLQSFAEGETVEAWHRVTGRVVWCGDGPGACVGVVDDDGTEWDFSIGQVRRVTAP